MGINYVKQMNAFIEQSAGKLGAKEQAMYLRLFGIANSLGWPEWFDVANSQLMRELGIKSEHTIIAMKRKLQVNGFILSKRTKRTSATKYKLLQKMQ